jgi:prevent-host-death family protein
MKVVPLTAAKNDLSRYVDRVRQGETVRITVHGTPVADLVPISVAAPAGDDWGLEELERAGLVRRARKAREAASPDRRGPRVRGDAVAALIAERRGGR